MLKIKKIFKLALIPILLVAFAAPAFAATQRHCSPHYGLSGDKSVCVHCQVGYDNPPWDTKHTVCVANNNVQNQLNTNPIFKDLNTVITYFLTPLVGIVIVGNLIAGGIEYSTAGGESAKVSAARKRIGNTFIALFAFLLLWAFVQWLVPGGVFG